jgi:hypothetical protein
MPGRDLYGSGSLTVGPGSLTPATPGFYNPAYGGIPQVPNPTATQTGALRGNIGNLASIYGITGGIDTSGINTLATATQGAVPGLTARLHGELPPDVINLLQQQAAERGVSTGTGFRGGDYLKALGLTSLGVSTDAAKELETEIGRAPLIDPNRLLVTPDQAQEAQMASNLYRAAPIPADAAGASMGNALSGLRAGLGAVPTFAGGGAYGGARDALGFPIESSTWDSQNVPQTAAYGALNPTASDSTSSFDWNAFIRGLTPQASSPGAPFDMSGGLAGTEDEYGFYE